MGHFKQRVFPRGLFQVARLTMALGAFLGLGSVQAQGDSATPSALQTPWQHCANQTHDREARLNCFDRWASQQPTRSSPTALTPEPVPMQIPTVTMTAVAPAIPDCRNPRFSEISRFWELEGGSDCGTFNIRGYRPISLSWIGSDSVNFQPASPSPGHTAVTSLHYSPSETRIQFSVRTKIAQGLLTQQQPVRRDSLWFGYTQQSYWQLFTGEVSRPFRSTDHEPELTYVYPTDAALPLGWRLRYSGLSMIHQSNGQGLPLSRSWNRLVLMAGMEKGSQFRLQGRVWKRLNEDADDDDNPGISDLIGRAEVTGFWDVNKNNTLGITVRHSLHADANGSVRLEWLRTIADTDFPGGKNGLRFHTQLFTGYGDSLVDYNRRRTVLSIGLSLVDW